MTGHHKYPNLSGQELRRLARLREVAEAQLENLGAAIMRARKAKRWSRPRLAREIPVDPKTIERWEKGLSGGAMESLDVVAEKLETTADAIIADSLPKPDKSRTPDPFASTDGEDADQLDRIEEKLDEVLDRLDSQEAAVVVDDAEQDADQESQRNGETERPKRPRQAGS